MFNKVWNVVTTILVGMMAVLAILLVGVRLVGLQPYAVLSGSMTPAYPVGAMIYVKSAQPEEISVGDPITFSLDGATLTATHRVIRIDAEKKCFFTKGDANASPDGEPVYFNHLIGTPVFSIPVLGYVSSFVTTPPGLYIAILTAVIIIAMTFLPGLVTKAGRSDGPEEEAQNAPKGTDGRKRRKAARAAVKSELTVK